MKKSICILLALLLMACLPLTAAASETVCTVSADAVTGEAGGQVSVPIRISDNPGFTNFGIALDYDRELLTLLSIRPETDLCGGLVSANTAWQSAEAGVYGYVTCASAGEIAEDGILFTATFQISEDFADAAEVVPVVRYLRSNEADPAVFEEIAVQAKAGTVQRQLLAGDFDGNGAVSLREAAKVIRCFSGIEALTEAEKPLVDTDGDGSVSLEEVTAVLNNYNPGA